MSSILSISNEMHDSGIAVVENDGQVKLAVNEERFSRVKKEGRYPRSSLKYKEKKR